MSLRDVVQTIYRRKPDRSVSPSSRLMAATIGSAVVAATTCAAFGLGMLSPMATDSCGSGSTEPECVNEGTYAALLTVGPTVLGAAVLGAVWFRAMHRPRLIWFAVWPPLLVAIFLRGNSLAGGNLF
jgi:hypothetical protein